MTDLVTGRGSSSTPKRITFTERSTEVECGEVLLTLVVVLGLEGGLGKDTTGFIGYQLREKRHRGSEIR